jgi:hypothetical protein
MASSFGWLDADDEQRRKMLEIVDLFKEEGTLDELGIGSIRDALADLLFPGTSTLHTRLRYVFFIPWLLEQAAHQPSAEQMGTEFRRLEYRLIGSLLAGGERRGVIGNTARDSLKRLPSAAYWSALGVWGITNGDFSASGYFRRRSDYRQLTNRTVRADDPGAHELLPSTGVDPHLPPAPSDLLKATQFALRPEDEQYLSDRIAASTAGTMLSWLVRHQPGNDPAYAWQLDNLGDSPEQVRDLVDHARRFHTAIHGAAILYNLLLARQDDREELVAEYERSLSSWREVELNATAALVGWDRSAWWETVRRRNPRLRDATVRFVNSWLDLISSGVDPATSSDAERLIRDRERQIKGGRARSVNQSALDRWPGGTGLGRHDFRWLVARAHLADLYAARASP